MPSGIDVEERFGSRRNNGGTIEFLYLATGSDDEEDLREAIFLEAPVTYSGIKKEGVTDLEQQGNGLWFGTVSYPGASGGLGGADEAKQSFEFDTSTGTQHITEALDSNRSVYSLGDDDGPDFGTAINVDSDLNIDGVDIGVKAFDFSVTRKIPIDDVDATYLTILYDQSWTYNKDASIAITMIDGVTVTFPAGTILFKGARGGAQEGELVSITFLFSFSPNLTNFLVDDILVASKLGWQYCWAFRVPKVVSASGGKDWLVPKAVSVQVDDLYYGSDLDNLAID